MQYFVVEIYHEASIEIIETLLDDHKQFLDEGYKNGTILMSGPQIPRIGGIIIAKAESIEKLAEFFQNDPLMKNEASSYKYIPFQPIEYQNFLSEWVED